ncbi:MAG: hypothetical protein V1758_04160 [Pseudomonadota bacterium]
MMTQGELAFKYEVDHQGRGVTGMVRSIERHVKARKGGQGWTDAEHVLSLVMLNLAGGDCVEDVDRLESDAGFCRLLSKAVSHGLSRKGRGGLKKRWRKERIRSVPSSSAVFRYLSEFHERDQEGLREAGKAFIPEANEALKGLCKVNKDLVVLCRTTKQRKGRRCWRLRRPMRCAVMRDIQPTSLSTHGGLSKVWCCIPPPEGRGRSADRHRRPVSPLHKKSALSSW